MSHTSRRYRTAADRGAVGLPLWAGLAIVVAALVTGMLISIYFQEVGAIFLGCFAAAALVVALFTQPRGLFITVANIPIAFGFFTVLTAWLVGRQLSPNVSGISATSAVTAVYPLLQFFPVLILVFLGAVAIACIRLALLRRQLQRAQERHVAERRTEAEKDYLNQQTASKARRRSADLAPRTQEDHHEEAATTEEPAPRVSDYRRASRPEEPRRYAEQDFSPAPARPTRERHLDDAPSTWRYEELRPVAERGPRQPRMREPYRPSDYEAAPGSPDRYASRRYLVEEDYPRMERRPRPSAPAHNSHADVDAPTAAPNDSGVIHRERRRAAQGRSNQVTVQELLARNEAQRRRNESLNRDLYDD